MGYFCIGLNDKTFEDFIKTAQNNLKLLEEVGYDITYAYLVGFATSCLEKAQEIEKKKENANV